MTFTVHADPSLEGAAPSAHQAHCESEPIHIPGAIQPHGAVIAALAQSGLVSHSSLNLAAILGRPAEAVLGHSLENAIGDAACRALLDVGTSDSVAAEQAHSLCRSDGGMLSLRAHRTGRHLLIDIEPLQLETQRRPIFMARSVVGTFKHAGSVVELCELAVQGLKAISGYGRVMAYRFHEDGHGEVIAEAREASIKAYLGQHYPASDIPPQARRLYLRQRVGSIADSSETPVLLCADSTLDDGSPLDLTHSALRSPSPVHRQYMRNMNTAASLTIGLAHGPNLWGMLVCHHTEPRCAGFELRAAADLIGQVVSLLLVSTGEAELLARRLQRQTMLRALVDSLAAPVPLADALAAAGRELLQVVGASGAAARLSGTLVFIGRTPALRDTESAIAALQSMSGGDPVAVDNLGTRQGLAGCIREASGALLLPLASAGGDMILWFRPEATRTIVWGGNPAEQPGIDPATARISPRTSFAAWEETVKGRSAPWTEADLALAREVRNTVEAEMAKRVQAALRESQSQLGLIVEYSSDVIMLIGLDGIRHYVSPAVERLLGWRAEEMVGISAPLGGTPAEFVHPEDQQILIDARTAMQTGDVGEYSVCFRHLRRDGSWLWVDSRARVRVSADGRGPSGIVAALRDATDRKTAEIKLKDALEQMERMAATDGLTGLANRRHFDGVADKEWRRCRRENQPLSVLLLDADYFKHFNDRYGHLAGDDCLRAIASRLADTARRPGDLAARYGGEEFLVLMPNTERDGALRMAERVREVVLHLAIAHEGSSGPGVVTVSIGGATAWPNEPRNDLTSVNALLGAADAALYQAKSRGRNQVVIALE